MLSSKESRFHVIRRQHGKLPDRSDPFAAHPVSTEATAQKQMIIITETRKIMQRLD